MTPVSIGVNGLTNTSSAFTRVNLRPFIPYTARSVSLLITHARVNTTAGGITIGHQPLGFTNTIMNSVTVTTNTLVWEQPLLDMILDVAMSGTAATGSYSVQILGFSI